MLPAFSHVHTNSTQPSQLSDMVALFDAEVVEFDLVPIMQRLMKDPFSAGNEPV